MIDQFDIDPQRGSPDQVGLFVKADQAMADRFRTVLRRAGFVARFMPSRRTGFSHFAYVSIPDQTLSKDELRRRLEPVCQASLAQSAQARDGVDYAAWQQKIDGYIRQYADQHFTPVNPVAEARFDKGLAYRLIQERRLEEAEHYLARFLSDAPPPLVLAYHVALYAAGRRPADIVALYGKYQEQFRSSDVDRRVVEWVVEAYLSLTPAQPEAAIAVLDDFLPEFQRQGVAERLLALRTQARALQGQIPQTLPELRDFIGQTPADGLASQIADILEAVTGLALPLADVLDLLQELEARLRPAGAWRVVAARSDLAQRAGQLDEALAYLRPLLEQTPAGLTAAEADLLRLTGADLALKAGEAPLALTWLGSVAPDGLAVESQRAYWVLLGQANQRLPDPPAALAALRRAYELGQRTAPVLQVLAELAYQAEDLGLAAQAYRDLLTLGFEPSRADHLRTGILAWLDNDWPEALRHLPVALRDPALDRRTVETLAYTAWVKSLLETRAPPEEIAEALQEWLDTIFAQGRRSDAEEYLTLLAEASVDRATQFALMEPLEAWVGEAGPLRQKLAEHYERLASLELDACLRSAQPLPEYVVGLRRGLFSLDRTRFDFLQEFIGDELRRARQAETVPVGFTLEPAAETLDLRRRWVALVGGYEPVRRRVREHLTREHQLGKFTEVPPSFEEHIDQQRVAEAVLGADLIVVMHRCIKHDGTNLLNEILDGRAEAQRLRYAAGKGHSSVLRVVADYFGGGPAV